MEKFTSMKDLLCAHYCYSAKGEDGYHRRIHSFDIDGHQYQRDYNDINELLASNSMDCFLGLEIYLNGSIWSVHLTEDEKSSQQSLIRIQEALVSKDVWSLLDSIIKQSMNHNIPWQKPEVDFKELLKYHSVLSK